MQTVGPYTLLDVLGRCDVGSVWSAVDSAGGRFTVAILDAGAAEQGWREPFSATATALGQAQHDGLPIVGADHAAPAPWVACPAEDGPGAAQVFLALGLRYQPAAPSDGALAASPGTPPTTDATATAMLPTVGGTALAVPGSAPGAPGIPAQPAPAPVVTPMPAGPAPLPAPLPPAAAHPQPVQPSALQTAVEPQPVSGVPAYPVSGPSFPVSGPPAFPVSGMPQPFSAIPADPYATPKRTPRWRATLWFVVVALLALAAGGTGGALIFQARAGKAPADTPASLSPADLGLPSAAPAQPGLEPPKDGNWPEAWPRFSSNDRTKPMTGLRGIGFSFLVPDGWTCTESGHGAAYVRYDCGINGQIGGQLTVRQCPKLCTAERRAELRQQEEAWGLRWISGGAFSAWAHTKNAGGPDRYGLVYVSYWRSIPEDAIDRQLVFRMTSPLNQSDEIKKVANSIRDATIPR